MRKTGFLQLLAKQTDAENTARLFDCANAPIFRLDLRGCIASWNKVRPLSALLCTAALDSCVHVHAHVYVCPLHCQLTCAPLFGRRWRR